MKRKEVDTFLHFADALGKSIGKHPNIWAYGNSGDLEKQLIIAKYTICDYSDEMGIKLDNNRDYYVSECPTEKIEDEIRQKVGTLLETYAKNLSQDVKQPVDKMSMAVYEETRTLLITGAQRANIPIEHLRHLGQYFMPTEPQKFATRIAKKVLGTWQGDKWEGIWEKVPVMMPFLAVYGEGDVTLIKPVRYMSGIRVWASEDVALVVTKKHQKTFDNFQT
jgi:hypothetical protein